MTQPNHIFTGNDKDTEPLRALQKKPTGPWPVQPQNPADYYKKLGAQNDEAMLKELKAISAGVMVLAIAAVAWVGLSIVALIFFWHAINVITPTTLP